MRGVKCSRARPIIGGSSLRIQRSSALLHQLLWLAFCVLVAATAAAAAQTPSSPSPDGNAHDQQPRPRLQSPVSQRIASVREAIDAIHPRFCSDCLELCRNPTSQLPRSENHWWRNWGWYMYILDIVVSNFFPFICCATVQSPLP
jgi:hypothetical protein